MAIWETMLAVALGVALMMAPIAFRISRKIAKNTFYITGLLVIIATAFIYFTSGEFKLEHVDNTMHDINNNQGIITQGQIGDNTLNVSTPPLKLTWSVVENNFPNRPVAKVG